MKISDHFDIRELVPPETFSAHGVRSVSFIDSAIPKILERIRSLCGNKAITVNNWHSGGKFKYRGYRPQDCPIGAKLSMHKQGKAVDFTVSGMTAEQVRNVIRANAPELFGMGLKRLEKDVSWIHIDMKYTGLNTIYEFKP